MSKCQPQCPRYADHTCRSRATQCNADHSLFPTQALVRFAETVSSGAYYEAQQVLKSVYHRMRSRQQLENSYELASRAAVIQFGAAQSTCGAELGQLLIGDYETDKVAVTPGSLQRVMAILYAAAAAGMVDQLIALAKAALKWILACQGSRADAAQVHDCVAQHIYDAKGLAAATPFFVRASSLRPFAAAVKHVADEGGDSHEQGLFLLRAVLQSLLACDQMVEQGGDRCGPLLEAFSECQDPAAHFARLLLVVC